MRYSWIILLVYLATTTILLGYEPPDASHLQSEHNQRTLFNKKRLDEMQGKLQMLGRILASKEGKLAFVNNTKFDLEIEMGDLEINLKALQSEISTKQNKIGRLIKSLVALITSKDDSMSTLIVVKVLRENIVKLDSDLKDFEQQMIALKSKIMMVSQKLINFEEQETFLSEQLQELKETRSETLEAMSEIEKQIENLLHVKLVDDSVPVKDKTTDHNSQGVSGKRVSSKINFTVIMPLESFKHTRVSKKGTTLHFQDRVAILAPANGRVAYLGQLGNLGEVAIIDHGEEYRSILLGKATYTIGSGENVIKGDVIGHAKVDGLNGGTAGQIYFEIRHKNVPQKVTSFIDSQYNVQKVRNVGVAGAMADNVSLNTTKSVH